MEDKNIQQQLDDIKLQLGVITDYIEESKRTKESLTSLKNDISIIGKDVFEVAVKELEDVSDHFDTSDFIYLFKRLLRNVKNFNNMLDSVESATDFIKDLTPLSKQIFDGVLESLNEFEKKGYFNFLTEILNITDVFITSFNEEDLKTIGKNITTVAEIMKKLTNKNLLNSVNNVLTVISEKDKSDEKKISTLKIIKEMNNQETKKSLLFAFSILNAFSGNIKK